MEIGSDGVRIDNYEGMVSCSECGSKEFHIVISRWRDPLVNDEEYYCAGCGRVVQLPHMPVKEGENAGS